MHIPDRLDTAPAHHTGTEVLVLEEDGTITARGRIEESDATTGTHKIRNAKGHIVTAKSSRTFSVQEAEAIVESHKGIPDPVEPEEERESVESEGYGAWYKRVAVLAVLFASAFAFALFVLSLGNEQEATVVQTGSVAPPAPRSEVEILTEELNALNLKRAPLIESCATLKATESEIRLRTDRLSTIRNR